MKISELLDELLGLLVLIYGRSGSGKTAAARNLEPTTGRIITSERNGLRTLKRLQPRFNEYDVRYPRTVKEFHDEVAACVSEPLEWLNLDTVSSYYDMLWQEYLDTKKKQPDEVQRRNYNYCKHWFENLMHLVVDVADSGTHVFMTCHLKWSREGDDKNPIVWSEPDLPGILPERVNRRLDIVARSEYRDMGGKAHYLLRLPVGRSAGKDLLGAFERGPIANDFRHFLQYGGGERHSREVSNEQTAPPPSTPSPPAPVSPALVKRLKTYCSLADMSEDELAQHCHETYGERDYTHLAPEQFRELLKTIGEKVPL